MSTLLFISYDVLNDLLNSFNFGRIGYYLFLLASS